MIDYLLSDTYNFCLPRRLIATLPEQRREQCKLMALSKRGDISHKHFYDVIDYMNCGDVLVLNDSKVIAARIFAYKKTSAKVEILLLKKMHDNMWQCLVKGKNIKDGDSLYIDFEDKKENKKIECIVKNSRENIKTIEFSIDINNDVLSHIGNIPLPPYIIQERKERGENEYYESDKIYYQNVFAKHYGSVASPTASLHFTENLLKRINDKGIDIIYITLHVGFGTFSPLKTKYITKHIMHYESFFIDKKSTDTICQKKYEGKNIIASGTTVARVLESEYNKETNSFNRGSGETNIFIYPPYTFKCVDKLITNFHTPCSTLLAMVSAFGGYENTINAYRYAIENNYRFFSYGDAMIIF